MIAYFRFELRSIENIKVENDRDTFYFMLSYIPSMPELKCSTLGIEDECIDITKAKAFSYYNEDYYKKVFSFKKVILDVNSEKVKLYDWNPNDYLPRKITSPVSIYDPKDRRYYIGVLEVYMYEE